MRSFELPSSPLHYPLIRCIPPFLFQQWRVFLNSIDKCTLPLFLTLCFDEMRKWRSYALKQETVIPPSVESAISGLFEQLERRYGYRLVSHTLGYGTGSIEAGGRRRASLNDLSV